MSGWEKSGSKRVASSMMLGKGGGDVYQAHAPGALLASREAATYARRSMRPKMRRMPPPLHQSGCYTLFAGYVHNRDEMLDRLGLSPTTSNALLYAEAYARFGANCDHELIGDYASILWFADKRTLRLAVSPMSMQPLHLWRDGSRIVASSNPRMIFACGVQPLVDDDKLADSLMVNFSDTTQSWYKGLSRVAPGTCEIHTPDGVESTRFWSISEVKPVRFVKDEDYVEAVAEQFDRAVTTAMQGASCPGIMLSGGLDSQTVASFAVNNLAPEKQLRSYTWKPVDAFVPNDHPGFFDNETDHVRELAAMYPQLVPSFISEPDVEFGHYHDSIFLLSGWPSYSYLSWVDRLLEQSYSDGCDVMLTGALGNPTFSYDGMTGLAEWLRSGNWVRLISELRKQNYPRSFLRRLYRMAIKPNLPLNLKKRIDQAKGVLHSPFDLWVPMKEDFATGNGAMERAEELGFDYHFFAFSSAAKMRELSIQFFEAETAQIHQGTRLLHGVEVRQPLAYRPFVELCAGIPDSQYLRGGQNRWLARRLLKGRIPEVVRTELREGNDTADWPIHMMKHRPGLLKEMEALKTDERLGAIFDFDRLHETLEQWDGTNAPGSYNETKIPASIGRAIRTARFVKHVEGRNVG